MNKGCMYWLFVGFWLEPMILFFKFILCIFKEILYGLVDFGKTAELMRENQYDDDDDDWDGPVSKEDLEDMKNEMREEIKEELYNELYDEVYQNIVDNIENKRL